MTAHSSPGNPRVILIHPFTGFWDGFRSAPCLPLNLLHAASLVAGEFDVELIDVRIHADWKKRLRLAMEIKPVLVGVTSMIGPATTSSIRIAESVKRLGGVPVVMGGVHPTLSYKSVLAENSIDYVVRGEGEIPLLRLARMLLEGGGEDNIPGLLGKNENGGDSTGIDDRIDLNTCPEIPYRIVETKKYLQYYGGVANYISMETSRGCSFRCGYCYNSLPEYSGWRAQSPGKVYERARCVKERFNAGGVYFVDDNFFVDKGRAAEIAGFMAKLALEWQVQGLDIATLKDMDEGYLSHLASSGLRRITVGIETGSDRLRNEIGKPLRRPEVIDTIKKLKPFPIVVYCSFIANFPGETASDLKSTMSLIVELAGLNPYFRNSPVYQFVPFPGTQIARKLERRGFRWPQRFGEWAKYSFETGYGADNSGLGRGFYRALYFTTLFSDGKFEEYISSPILKLFSRLYSPVALFRLKKSFMKPIPEMKLFFLIRDLLLTLHRFART